MNKKKINYIMIICFALVVIYTLLNIFTLNILPLKYVIPIVMILLLLFCGLSYALYKDKASILIRIVIVILCILLLIATFYIRKSNGTLRKITHAKDGYAQVSVIVMKNSKTNKLSDLKDKRIGYSKTGQTAYTYKALSDIQKELNESPTLIAYKSMDTFSDDLFNEQVDAVLLDEGSRATLEDKHPQFSEKTKVIKTFEYKIAEKDISKDVKVTTQPFNIYITGIDTYGKVSAVGRSDVNMVATINPNTKQILLTSIPRDYYIRQTCQNNQKDKLTHTGIFGVDCTIDSVEKFFGVEVNYYARVNFSSLEKIVNALGGIVVDNPHDFSVGNIHFSKGQITMNGVQALAYSRERYAFIDGDFERGRDQMRVLTAIIHKITSPSILTNYASTLDAISDTFQTNLSEHDIKAFINMQLNDMKGWNVKQISVDGNSGTDWTPANGFNASVVYPDMKSVKAAVDKIKAVENGELQS